MYSCNHFSFHFFLCFLVGGSFLTGFAFFFFKNSDFDGRGGYFGSGGERMVFDGWKNGIDGSISVVFGENGGRLSEDNGGFGDDVGGFGEDVGSLGEDVGGLGEDVAGFGGKWDYYYINDIQYNKIYFTKKLN